jgi:hypothetical protein
MQAPPVQRDHHIVIDDAVITNHGTLEGLTHKLTPRQRRPHQSAVNLG